MKVCLLCGTPAEDNTATCKNDGEASWGHFSGPSSAVPAPESTTVVDEVAKRGPGRPKKS